MTAIPLVQALERAAQEPAQRPAFYRALMKADVFVIGHTDQPDLNAHGHHTIPAGANVSLVNWEKADGTPVIPFFSHLEALQQAIDDDNYVAFQNALSEVGEALEGRFTLEDKLIQMAWDNHLTPPVANDSASCVTDLKPSTTTECPIEVIARVAPYKGLLASCKILEEAAGSHSSN